MNNKDQIFISYASEDFKGAQKLCFGLQERGLKVWLDKQHLKLGKWKRQIKKAIANSRYFIICLSEAALKKTGNNKPGFQNEELQDAYEIAQMQSPEVFTIIPIRLENCSRGDFRVSGFQQFDFFIDWDSEVNKLAVLLGGISLTNKNAIDVRSKKDIIFDSYLGKAETYYYAGDFNNALKVVEAIEVLEHPNNKSLYLKGIILKEQGRDVDAISTFNEALSLHQNDFHAQINKGIILGELKRYEEALEAFTSAACMEPDSPEAFYNMAVLLSHQNHLQKAIDLYGKALTRQPDDFKSLLNRGNIFRRLGCAKEAIEDYNKALLVNPYSAELLCNKATLLGGLSQYQEALELFDKAISIKSDLFEAIRGRGVCLVAIGHNKKALKWLDKALKIKQEDNITMIAKHQALKNLGN